MIRTFHFDPEPSKEEVSPKEVTDFETTLALLSEGKLPEESSPGINYETFHEGIFKPLAKAE